MQAAAKNKEPRRSRCHERPRSGLVRQDQAASPQRLAEVEDFVDFLREREAEQRLTHAAANASEASFAQVCDNDEDAAYDRM